MTVVSTSMKDYKAQYQGFERMEVGLGSISPNIFATQSYRKKKTDKIIMGGIQEIRYTGAEHDLNPMLLVIGYEPAYNTILAYNLHYIPRQHRTAIINIVLKSNHARIKGQKAIIVDYNQIKKAIPASANIVRRYKLQGIKIVEQFPLVEWTKAISRKSRWEGWFKKNQSKSNTKTVNGFKKTKRK